MRTESIFAASASAGLDPVVAMLVIIVIAAIMTATFIVLKLVRNKKAQSDTVTPEVASSTDSAPRDA